MKTLEIPSEYLELCESWHGGQDSMFYAISSTEALSLGTHSKIWGEQDSDEFWMLGLMEDTIREIKICIGHCENGHYPDDKELLERFLSYMETKKSELEKTRLGILV